MLGDPCWTPSSATVPTILGDPFKHHDPNKSPVGPFQPCCPSAPGIQLLWMLPSAPWTQPLDKARADGQGLEVLEQGRGRWGSTYDLPAASTGREPRIPGSQEPCIPPAPVPSPSHNWREPRSPGSRTPPYQTARAHFPPKAGIEAGCLGSSPPISFPFPIRERWEGGAQNSGDRVPGRGNPSTPRCPSSIPRGSH